jgi:hypothetical protein
LLGRLDGVNSDGSGGVGTIKSCGTRLPPFTSDVACDAFQIEFPDAMWESPMMPRFTTTGNTTAFEPGGILTLNPAVGLVGLDVMNNVEGNAGVFPMTAGAVTCEAGEGADCFPDHDGDSHEGVTINLRHDAATYDPATLPNLGGLVRASGDTNFGKCSLNAMPYKYRGAPTNGLDIGAGGGAGGGVRAVQVRIGLRTRLGGAGAINNDCASGVGDSECDMLDSRAWSCKLDPTTYPAGVTYPMDECDVNQAKFVDDNVPIYRVLGAGQMAGPVTTLPNGWAFVGRNIDTTASRGPKSALVRLGDLTGGEPTCAAVRGAAYPAL